MLSIEAIRKAKDMAQWIVEEELLARTNTPKGVPNRNLIVMRDPGEPKVIIKYDIEDRELNSIVAEDDREALFIRTELERILVTSEKMVLYGMSVNGVQARELEPSA